MMWPRISEIVIGFWLVLSPPLFDGEAAVLSRVLGVAVLLFSGGALVDRFRRAYLVTFAISLGMIGWVLMRQHPVATALENIMISGLLLAMFAILPPEDNQPPRPWRRLERAREEQGSSRE